MDFDLEPIDVRATPVEPAGAEPATSRRRWVLAGGLALVLGAGVGIEVIGGAGDAGGRPPEEAMAAPRSFLSEATSVHFDATWSPAQGGPPDVSKSPASLSRFQGDVRLPYQGHWVHDNGYHFTEGLTVEGGAYYRVAQSRRRLRTTPWRWTVRPEPAALGEHPIGSFVIYTQGLPLGLNGLDFAALRHLADGVSSTEPMGDGVYRGQVRLAGLPDGGPPLFGYEGRGTVEFTVAGNGRLERAVWRPKPGSRVVLNIRFSRWGQKLALAVPDIDDVDLTPEIDEEAVAAFRAAPLLAPAALPEGWALHGAYVPYPSRPCPSLEFWYAPAFDPRALSRAGPSGPLQFLQLTQWPADCQQPEAVPTAGNEAGRGDTVQTAAVATVGATRVEGRSGFPEAELRRVLDHLVLLDLDTLPVQRSVPPAG